MKFTVNAPQEIDVAFLKIDIPIRYGDEDIAYDFPLRDGDVWQATVDVSNGSIKDWPKGESGTLYTKVTDSGTYSIHDADMNEIKRIDDYVPHGMVPGEYGDYINLEIDESGVITNFNPTSIDEFYPSED